MVSRIKSAIYTIADKIDDGEIFERATAMNALNEM